MGKAERIENPQGPERVRQRYSFSKKFFKNFLFCVGVQPIYNVVLVSGEQRRDSAVHINVSILPQTPLPFRLPHNLKQSSLCYTVGPCWLYILNFAVCTCASQTL